MEISILFFGQLTEITGESRLVIRDIKDTDSLLAVLKERFPLLSKKQFVFAVNRKIIKENMVLPAAAEVALLPPFSGG